MEAYLLSHWTFFQDVGVSNQPDISAADSERIQKVPSKLAASLRSRPFYCQPAAFKVPEKSRVFETWRKPKEADDQCVAVGSCEVITAPRPHPAPTKVKQLPVQEIRNLHAGFSP